MRYRTLGHSGLTVSVVGIGCNYFGWRLGAAEVRALACGLAAVRADLDLLHARKRRPAPSSGVGTGTEPQRQLRK